ncbi:hypothetical protein BGX31_003969 [Mortierella sp. GBA43]|nr:hypothetical protein BGX31_003969 [Mortierella sp. GBA43]
MTWTVPSVGNATTPGGTVGACPSNSFHVEYSGKYKVFLFEQSWGPVKCTPITILPDPGIVPTTTTIAPTSTTRSSSTTSATASPTTTDTGDSQQGSGPSTSVVAIVSVVAALVLFLVLFGTWWHLRKKRRQRMEDAIMPWTNQPGNQFTKVPSTDGDRNEVAGSGSNYKPAAPEPSHAAPNYQDNGYGYGQHGQHGAGGYGYNNGYGNGYDNGQDDYYNTHYAGQNVQGYPPHPGNGPSPSYYNEYSGRSSPQLDPYQKNPQTGYFPPPALSSKSSKSSPSAPRENLVYNSQSSASLTTSPSSRRAPQVIVPDKSTSQDDGGQHIPMKDMSSR